MLSHLGSVLPPDVFPSFLPCPPWPPIPHHSCCGEQTDPVVGECRVFLDTVMLLSTSAPVLVLPPSTDLPASTRNHTPSHRPEPHTADNFSDFFVFRHLRPFSRSDSSRLFLSTPCCFVTRSCLTLCDPTDCSLPGLLCPWDSPGKNPGVGCVSFSRGASQPSRQTLISCTGRWILCR